MTAAGSPSFIFSFGPANDYKKEESHRVSHATRKVWFSNYYSCNTRMCVYMCVGFIIFFHVITEERNYYIKADKNSRVVEQSSRSWDVAASTEKNLMAGMQTRQCDVLSYHLYTFYDWHSIQNSNTIFIFSLSSSSSSPRKYQEKIVRNTLARNSRLFLIR